MVFRKATTHDTDGIMEIYNAVLDLCEKGTYPTGWVKGIYPTQKTVSEALSSKTMFVCENDGKIVACAKIDNVQVDVYDKIDWVHKAPKEQVMVMHTLAVHPDFSGCGIAGKFCVFYEQYALCCNCHYLRIDTNQKNLPARALYKKLGYRESGIVECVFNGIEKVKLVCMEKKI